MSRALAFAALTACGAAPAETHDALEPVEAASSRVTHTVQVNSQSVSLEVPEGWTPEGDGRFAAGDGASRLQVMASSCSMDGPCEAGSWADWTQQIRRDNLTGSWNDPPNTSHTVHRDERVADDTWIHVVTRSMGGNPIQYEGAVMRWRPGWEDLVSCTASAPSADVEAMEMLVELCQTLR